MNRPQQVPDNYAEATTNNSVIHAERATESYIQSDKTFLIGASIVPSCCHSYTILGRHASH